MEDHAVAQTITNSDAEYALDIVKVICAEVGPGLPVTLQERERAAIIKRELETHLGTGNVRVEEFTLAPRACLAAYPLSGLLMLVAALLNPAIGRFTGVSPWLTAVPALALSIAAPLVYLFEFVLGFEFIDRFFKKKQSVNMIGLLRRPGTKNVKRILILSGHHDSAPENTWLHLLGYGMFLLSATYFIGLVTMLVMSLLQVVGLMIGSPEMVRAGTLCWVLLAFPIAPSVIYAALFNRGWKDGGTVPGAADNLSGSALAIAMCRFLVKNPMYIPEETEIRFISFGSEEVGLRGSRRYVERHLDELKRLEARLLNFETVVYPEITILTSDMNGTVKNDPEMVKSTVAAAGRARVPYKVSSATLGVATDAAPFTQAGLKATTLLPFKIPQQLVAFYHQKWDTPEVLSIEPLLNVSKLTLEWICAGGDHKEQPADEPRSKNDGKG
jgi:hypothetical protein